MHSVIEFFVVYTSSFVVWVRSPSLSDIHIIHQASNAPSLSSPFLLPSTVSFLHFMFFSPFILLFVYFRNLNPSVSFASFSCFHSCTIDSVMSYSSSSSSFALPNLRLELSCETAYSWLLLLLFDLIMLSF